MTTLRASLFLSVLLLSSACSSPGRGSSSRAGSGDATNGLDCVRLVNGESIRGRILEDCSKDEFFGHPENRQPRTKDFLNKILSH